MEMIKRIIIIVLILFSTFIFASDVADYKMYISKYNFKLYFPDNWRISDESGTWFAIYSYTEESVKNPGLPVGSNELKIECYLRTKTKSSINELLNRYQNIIKKETIEMDNGKIAIEILREDEMVDCILSIMYYDGFKEAFFNCWPYNSKYVNDFYEVVKSFSFIYHLTKVNNLRLRKGSNLKSEIIKHMKLNERVEIIEIGKKEIIDNIEGNWVKVMTEYGETGWCFGGYLKKE